MIFLDSGPAANDNTDWIPFEVDGSAFEYITFPSRVGPGRPAGWPAYKPAPMRSKPCLTLLVRGIPGAAGAVVLFPDGVGSTFPVGARITVEDAIALVRMMLEFREE